METPLESYKRINSQVEGLVTQMQDDLERQSNSINRAVDLLRTAFMLEEQGGPETVLFVSQHFLEQAGAIFIKLGMEAPVTIFRSTSAFRERNQLILRLPPPSQRSIQIDWLENRSQGANFETDEEKGLEAPIFADTDPLSGDQIAARDNAYARLKLVIRAWLEAMRDQMDYSPVNQAMAYTPKEKR